MSDGLSALPLAVSFEWLAKHVTTDPPRYVPHAEWRLAVTVSAESAIRAAVLLGQGCEAAWGQCADDPAQEVTIEAQFFPSDWGRSADVQIAFGWQRLTVTDEALKQNPRAVVTITAPTAATGGRPFEVARLPRHDVFLAIVAVADEDTKRTRDGRWRSAAGSRATSAKASMR